MGKEWLWWLGEFGLASVVAVVAGFVTGDVPISILYGLFVGTVFFVLREFRRVITHFGGEVTDLEDKVLDLPMTPSHRENIDPFLKQIVQSERNELLRMAKEVTNGEIVLPARPIQQTIGNFHKLARPGDRVVAINTGAGWGAPQWEITRQIDFDLANKGVDITRIFIEQNSATPEDKKRLRQEMDRQKEHLKVRFIKESKLPAGVKQSSFLIVDRFFGYASYSKPVGTGIRQIADEVRFYTRREELEKAKEMADTLIKLSEGI